MSSFSERLDYLIRTVHPAGRGPMTHSEIAAEMAERGTPISTGYLSQLRTGHRGRAVSGEILIALAAFFGVDPRYFYDETVAAETNRELDMIAALRDAGVQRIATRSMGLSDGSRKAVEDMVEHLRAAEGVGSRTKNRDRGDG